MDTATPAAAMASIPVDRARGPTRSRQTTRAVVMGQDTFDELRRVQLAAPTPRLDLRYLLEAAVTLLDIAPCVRLPWLLASRQAFDRPIRRAPAADGAQTGTGAPVQGDTEGAVAATARTHGALPQARRADARSLRIGEACFVQLKAIQASTHDPRLEMRDLLDGAIALLMQREDLHGDWVWQSRQALLVHLLALQHHPIPSQVSFQRR